MIKLFTIIISFVFMVNPVLAAYTPLGVKGQLDAGNKSFTNVQVPNKLATLVAPGTYLLESGNGNILVNGGFEHSNAGEGWSMALGSLTTLAITPVVGAKAIRATFSAQTANLFQDSTSYAAAFADGINGTTYIRAKTTMSNMYLCRRQAGVLIASTSNGAISNCLLISNSGKWGEYSIPTIFGATSNGLAIVSLTPSTAVAVAVTGTIDLDDGKLEAGSKTQGSSAIGPWTTFTPTGLFTNTTYTGKWRQVGENIEVQVKGTLTGVPAGGLTIDIPSGFTIDTTKLANSVFTSELGRGSANDLSASAYYTFHVGYNGVTSVFVGYQAAITGQIVSSSPSAPFTWASGDTFSLDFSVPITQFSGSVSTYSTPSDSFSTDSNTLTHKTTAIVASDAIGTYNTYSYAINTNTKTICGTAPSTLPTSANGFLIYTRAYNAASTCGNPARVEIKIGATGDKFPTIKTDIYKSAGKVTIGELDYLTIGTSSQRGMAIKSYSEENGVLVMDAGINAAVTYTSNDFQFSDATGQTSGFLVINAQKAKSSIVGSFAEVVTSPGISKPKTCHYAFGGASATLASPTLCTTGTCLEVLDSCNAFTPPSRTTAGGYLTLAIASGTFSNSSPIVCTCNGFSLTNNARVCVPVFNTGQNTWSTNSSGGWVADIFTGIVTGTGTDSYVTVKCEGQAP